jgi:hypothetical protein
MVMRGSAEERVTRGIHRIHRIPRTDRYGKYSFWRNFATLGSRSAKGSSLNFWRMIFVPAITLHPACHVRLYGTFVPASAGTGERFNDSEKGTVHELDG